MIGVVIDGETKGGLKGEWKPTFHFSLKNEIEVARCEGARGKTAGRG